MIGMGIPPPALEPLELMPAPATDPGSNQVGFRRPA